jgi:hypothetical protein
MSPVPGSSHPHIPTEYLPSEMWNLEPPTEEPPKKKRKLSRSKVEKKLKKLCSPDCVKNYVLRTYCVIHWTYIDLLCLFYYVLLQ